MVFLKIKNVWVIFALFGNFESKRCKTFFYEFELSTNSASFGTHDDFFLKYKNVWGIFSLFGNFEPNRCKNGGKKRKIVFYKQV